jgi:hypothetical protein
MPRVLKFFSCAFPKLAMGGGGPFQATKEKAFLSFSGSLKKRKINARIDYITELFSQDKSLSIFNNIHK